MANINLAELREIEDSVKATLDSWPRVKLLIAYAYIRRGSNISMDQIDRTIIEEFKKQQESK